MLGPNCLKKGSSDTFADNRASFFSRFPQQSYIRNGSYDIQLRGDRPIAKSLIFESRMLASTQMHAVINRYDEFVARCHELRLSDKKIRRRKDLQRGVRKARSAL